MFNKILSIFSLIVCTLMPSMLEAADILYSSAFTDNISVKIHEQDGSLCDEFNLLMLSSERAGIRYYSPEMQNRNFILFDRIMDNFVSGTPEIIHVENPIGECSIAVDNSLIESAYPVYYYFQSLNEKSSIIYKFNNSLDNHNITLLPNNLNVNMGIVANDYPNEMFDIEIYWGYDKKAFSDKLGIGVMKLATKKCSANTNVTFDNLPRSNLLKYLIKYDQVVLSTGYIDIYNIKNDVLSELEISTNITLPNFRKTFSGSVRDIKGNCIAGIPVYVRNELSQEIVAIAKTNENGCFNIKYLPNCKLDICSLGNGLLNNGKGKYYGRVLVDKEDLNIEVVVDVVNYCSLEHTKESIILSYEHLRLLDNLYLISLEDGSVW